MFLHYEFYILLQYLSWWRTPLLPLFLSLWFLGGGTLLYLCGRYFARLQKAAFWRSLLANFAAVCIQLIAACVVMILVGLTGSPFASPLGKSWFVTPMGLAGILSGPFAFWWAVARLFRTGALRALKAAWLPLLTQAVFWLPLTIAVPMSASGIAYVISNRTVCMTHLSSIGKAISLYQGEHAGRMPPDLGTLVREVNCPPKLLQCPSEPTPGDANGWPYDYFYLPADAKTSVDRLLVCDFQGSHAGKYRNVLFVGMNVAKFDERAFQRELARPLNAEFAKALSAAEAQRAQPAPSSQPAPQPRLDP